MYIERCMTISLMIIEIALEWMEYMVVSMIDDKGTRSDDEFRLSAAGCVTRQTAHVYWQLSRRAALITARFTLQKNTFFATIVTRSVCAWRWPSHDYYFYTSGVSFSPSFERGMIVKISHRNEEHNYTGREEDYATTDTLRW